jgi:uncharacterized membrane protein
VPAHHETTSRVRIVVGAVVVALGVSAATRLWLAEWEWMARVWSTREVVHALLTVGICASYVQAALRQSHSPRSGYRQGVPSALLLGTVASTAVLLIGAVLACLP